MVKLFTPKNHPRYPRHSRFRFPVCGFCGICGKSFDFDTDTDSDSSFYSASSPPEADGW